MTWDGFISRTATGTATSGWAADAGRVPKAGRIIATFCAALALGSCSALVPGNTPPVETASEQEDTPTFVSLNPCLDAILVEVAEPEQILALSHYSRDPDASSMDPLLARQFGVTGGTAEEVLALQPDIVLASTFMPPATRSALERMGLRVETFGSPISVDQSVAQIRRVGLLTGRNDSSEGLVQRISNARASNDVVKGSVLVWQPGQIVPGEATLVNELLVEFGFVSHSAALGLGQADFVSLETLLANPPDVLLVAGDTPGQAHPLLAELRGTLVAEFPPNLLYCGGPTIALARTYLADIQTRFEHDFSQEAQP